MTSDSHKQIGYGAINNKPNPTTTVEPIDEKKSRKLKEQTHESQPMTTKITTFHAEQQHLVHYYHRCFWEYLSSRFCGFLLLSLCIFLLSVVCFTGFTVPSFDRWSVSGRQQQQPRGFVLDRNDGGYSSIAQYPVMGEEEVVAGGYDDLSKYTRKTHMSARRFSSTIQPTSTSNNNNNNNNSTKSSTTTTATSLSKRLFQANLDLAHQALQTHYLQNLTAGTLNPNSYGQYSIQDIGYCAVGLDDWKHVYNRATTSNVDDATRLEIERFAAARIRTWEWYMSTTYGEWHISNPAQSVVLSDAARRYVEFERMVCREYDLVYAAVVMAPCDRLWFWLGNEMKRDVLAAADGGGRENVYWGWIEDNASYEAGALELEVFIDANEGIIDEDLAMRVYRTAMMGEVNFFRWAGRQAAIPTSLL